MEDGRLSTLVPLQTNGQLVCDAATESHPKGKAPKHAIRDSEGAVQRAPAANDITLPNSKSLAYKRNGGAYYVGDCVEILNSRGFKKLKGKTQLIVTSPPYPLNEKKSYGNLKGETYLKWVESLAPIFAQMLTEDGSIIIELGNSWEPGRPVQSLLALEALLAFTKAKDAGLRLVQQFACYNPSRLPSPAAWVTVNPIRTVDSFTHVWWLAKTDWPKANNGRVLRPYSKAMKQLLARGSYNAGARPSQHHISEAGFLKDRGGSIAHNFFELEPLQEDREVRLPNAFAFSNTASSDTFHQKCQEQNIVPHPARMPVGLASFFIEYLTDPGDLVLDPFGGSNTTGFAAALAARKWIAIEKQDDYVEQSKLRFLDPKLKAR
ncbi:modification methylase PvuII [Burkholderia pseudomallei MSHR5613]|uniref:DNA-methyltransferase n=1 Tax=Burkholderia pseudomallei TaxID=28450 RepID=UPI000531B11E|nr:site-specific DNA-methyltransferase [Burkholderia pseudomallei]KGS55641.1 modification methylase PvuII [Burkholderia pseudomallei MSHR5613]